MEKSDNFGSRGFTGNEIQNFASQELRFDEDGNLRAQGQKTAVQLSNEEFLAKINSITPASGIKTYKQLLESKDTPKRLYPHLFNLSFEQALNSDAPSLMVYLGSRVEPKEFEPQDIYEVYSLNNYTKLLPIAAQLIVLSTIFSVQTHLLQTSKLFALTAENCLRCKFITLVAFPMIGYAVSKKHVMSNTKDEMDSYLSKYNLNQDKYVQQYLLDFKTQNSQE